MAARRRILGGAAFFAVAALSCPLSEPVVAAGPPQAPDQKAIRRAIDTGAKFLGKWVFEPQDGNAAIAVPVGAGSDMHLTGGTAIAGLAMLEAGVALRSPAVQHALKVTRSTALNETSTYVLALQVMFLDRAREERDEKLIQFLGAKLLAGQGSDGTWTYFCNLPDSARLAAWVFEDRAIRARTDSKRSDDEQPPAKKRTDLPDLNAPIPPPKAVDTSMEPKKPVVSPGPRPKGDKPESVAPSAPSYTPAGRLDARIDKIVADLGKAGGIRGARGDHSCTQFGLVGLWVARKYGLPCDEALMLTDKHFRADQGADGGWSYSGGGTSTPSMTCAGLMGLATGVASREARIRTGAAKSGGGADLPDLNSDKAIEAGLKCLGGYIAAPARDGTQAFDNSGVGNDYYFLFSLERVAVTFGLDTINKVDWYALGANYLLKNQGNDGSWQSNASYGHGVTTAFAVLFLSRANVVSDLSKKLEGRVSDPGKARLRGGSDLGKAVGGTPVPREPVAKSPPSPPEGSVRPAPEPVLIPVPAERGARELAAELNGAGVEFDVKLRELQQAKGAKFTDALVLGIAGQADAGRVAKAERALEERLTRMTAATLTSMCGDESKVLRRAAAVACGRKPCPEAGAALAAMLEDRDPRSSEAAHAALVAIFGKDLGSEPGPWAAVVGKK